MLESLLNKRASDKHDNLISFQSLPAVAAYSTADAVCSIIIFSNIFLSPHLVKEFRSVSLKLLNERRGKIGNTSKVSYFALQNKFLCLLKYLSL